jgi:hypothetical protein
LTGVAHAMGCNVHFVQWDVVRPSQRYAAVYRDLVRSRSAVTVPVDVQLEQNTSVYDLAVDATDIIPTDDETAENLVGGLASCDGPTERLACKPGQSPEPALPHAPRSGQSTHSTG